MPLYVKASPVVKGERSICGPYPESRFQKIIDYARIASSKGKYRPRREVYWLCGPGGPLLVRIYEKGRRVYPKEEKSGRAGKQYNAIKQCAEKSGGKCPHPPSVTEALLKRARRLPKKFVCPV